MSEPVVSKSIMRRLASQKGEPAPDFHVDVVADALATVRMGDWGECEFLLWNASILAREVERLQAREVVATKLVTDMAFEMGEMWCDLPIHPLHIDKWDRRIKAFLNTETGEQT